MNDAGRRSYKCSGSFQFAVAETEEERGEDDPESENDDPDADHQNEDEIISPALYVAFRPSS